MAQSKKRLLYLSNSYPHTVSGVSTVVRSLLIWMSPHYELGIICPNTTTRYARKVVDGITHYFLPSYPTPMRKDFRFITPNPFQLQKAIENFDPDLIHLQDPSPASIVLKEIALANNIPTIFSHHFTTEMILGYLPESFKLTAQNNPSLNKSILQLTCRLYEHSRHLVVPTQTIKNLLEGLTTIPISVISSGVDCQAFKSPDPQQIKQVAHKYHLPDHPFVFYLGRLDPEKNLEILLLAWNQIKSRNNFRLVIAGEGNVLNRLQDLAGELNISNSIIWTGRVNPQDLPPFYNHPLARAFAITSPTESQSIVTLNAIAAGLPVVAASAGALPELVIDGQSGYLCKSHKPQDFAKRLTNLLEHPDHARQLGAEGRKIAVKHDHLRIIKQYQNIYGETFL